MKLIDLLNKIANGEEVPKKIKAFGTIFYLESDGEYYSETSTNPLTTYFGEVELTDELNQFVEIIEEEPKLPDRLPIFTLEEFATMTPTDRFNATMAEYKAFNEIIDYLKAKEE